ncbi:hypothetical protein DLJ60_04470 [Micromonospora chalcea]|nr:hypothetical protein MCBG_02199 [Micromonospora sp. M42]KKJ93702.1 hypothetical protein LQ51_29365 [Micromonospora sp. HK10]ODB77306.1 hypothetical protein A8711_28465 [Micromonospora sp. II]RQW96447.1 hypothetical protein DLJ60_04470 [Micromonospora chalcea]RQX59940.1 hypothetical protein DLJ57_00350 [Micromonospora chalcea]
MTTMTATTTLVVQDPVDAYELFAHARTVLRLPLDGRWHLVDHGRVHMLQTLPGQGAPALASVHLPVDGSRHPGEPHAGIPGGYALLAFTTDGGDTNRTQRRHRDLAGQASAWLTHRRLRWTWSHADGPFTTNHADLATRGQIVDLFGGLRGP